MRILMISTDRKIFDPESSVRARMVEYGELFEHLSIICFSKEKHTISNISDKVTVYSTNSLNRWFYIKNAIKVGKTLEDIDAVTAQDPFETGKVAFSLSKILKAKLHLQIHTDLFSPYFTKYSFLNSIRVKIAKKILPHADGIRVVSRRIKRSLPGGLKAEAEILPIFTDANSIVEGEKGFKLEHKYPQFEIFVLQVVRLESEKDVKTSLLAFKEVVEKHPEVGFVIVGEGGLRNSLENYVKFLNLEDNVIFEGYQNDIISYYKTADIFLLSSQYEGYSLALVEAATAKLGIVTTDVGIAGEILEHNKSAMICKVGNVECLARYLSNLIEDPQKRNAIGMSALYEIQKNEISKEEYLKRFKENIVNC